MTELSLKRGLPAATLLILGSGMVKTYDTLHECAMPLSCLISVCALQYVLHTELGYKVGPRLRELAPRRHTVKIGLHKFRVQKRDSS